MKKGESKYEVKPGKGKYPPEGYSHCHFTIRDEVLEKFRSAINHQCISSIDGININDSVEEAFKDYHEKIVKTQR